MPGMDVLYSTHPMWQRHPVTCERLRVIETRPWRSTSRVLQQTVGMRPTRVAGEPHPGARGVLVVPLTQAGAFRAETSPLLEAIVVNTEFVRGPWDQAWSLVQETRRPLDDGARRARLAAAVRAAAGVPTADGVVRVGDGHVRVQGEGLWIDETVVEALLERLDG